LENQIKWVRQAVRRGNSSTITVPPEIVSALKINDGDKLEITTDGNSIFIKKAVL